MYGSSTKLGNILRSHGEIFAQTARSLYQHLVMMCEPMQTYRHMKHQWGCLRSCLLGHHRDIMNVGHMTLQEQYDVLDAMLSVVYDSAVETMFGLVSRQVSSNVTSERQTYGLMLDELLLDRYNHTCNSSRMYHRNRLEITILESFLVREDHQMLLNSSRLQLLRGIHRAASRFLQAEQNLVRYGERLIIKYAKLTKLMVRHDEDLQDQYNRTVQPVVDIIQDLSPAEKEKAKWHVFSNTVTKVVCRALLQLSGTDPPTTPQATLRTTGPGETTSPTTSPVPLPSQTDPPGVQLGEPPEMPLGKVEQTVVKPPPDLHVSSQVGSYPGGSPTTLALAIVFSVIGGVILGVLVTYCVVCRQGGKDSHESRTVVEVPASPPREKNEFQKNGSLNNLADTCNYINNTKKQDNYKVRNENFNHNQNANGSPSSVPNGTIPNGSPGQMASMHVKDSDIRRESLIDRERMAVSGYTTLDRDMTTSRKLPGVPSDTSPKHRYSRAHGPINPNEYDMGEFITPPKVPSKQTLPPRVPPKAGTLGRDGRPKPMGPKPVPPPKPPQLRMQQHHHHRHADS
ncbi:hypothetical protein Bbelb_429060 [Branchiostoma belcheri]|nr:hypothetical protein Bbelb_429060 [Branchiostoma belcheri]